MSRTQHVGKNGMKKGPWSKEEDDKLRAYIQRYGHWNWREIPRFAGVARCGKSCRLRWMNYLRPNMKHGNFTKEEEDIIVELHNKIGNKWSTIAAKLPGRSDNEIKNYWNTHLKKRGKRDQNILKNVHDESQGPIEANPINTPNDSSQSKDMDEVEALWASISSDSSSFLNGHEHDPYVQTQSSESLSISSHTSSADMASSVFSVSDCLISSGDSIQNNSEFDGNFWTEPLFPDYDSMRSTEHWADMDVVNSFIAPTDMTTNDEFLWSSIDLYSEYHSQLMN